MYRLWFLFGVRRALWFDTEAGSKAYDGVTVSCNGVTYTSPETLQPLDDSPISGEDRIGRYSGIVTKWNQCGYGTSYKLYANKTMDETDVMVASLFFTKNVEHTQIPNSTDTERINGVSCNTMLTLDLGFTGFLQFKGRMAGKDAVIGSGPAWSKLTGGVHAGPIAIFESRQGLYWMFGPLTNVMAASYVVEGNRLKFGIMGSVTEIPKGFEASFLAISRRKPGVQHAIATWGKVARQFHGKGSVADNTTLYLGYSTDNGAHYYYNTDEAPNYEILMRELKDYWGAAKVPVRHILLDSWWYYQDKKSHGVTNWTSRPEIFPHGLHEVHTLMKIPFIAHNRYWSDKAVYAKQNGGKYLFVMDNITHLGVPLESVFWKDLLRVARSWGVTVYEQDWMDVQFTSVRALYESATRGRTWLMQMGTAAADLGLHIQYCMAFPRHVLQSLEIPAVTQIRATEDYQPQHADWKQLGITSAFVSAVGLRPNKDNFYSSRATVSTQYSPSIETSNRLHACISTLSQSSVTISDTIGAIDRDLVMKSCRQDGLLLHPDAPAMLIDAFILRRASSPNSTGEVWLTQSCHQLHYENISTFESFCYKYVFAMPTQSYAMSLDALEFSQGTYYAFEHNSTRKLVVVSNETPLVLPAATELTFSMFTVATPLGKPPLQLVFLGEIDKWVPLSTVRFSHFDLKLGRAYVSVRMLIHGQPGEDVRVAWARYDDLKVVEKTIKIPPCGTKQFMILEQWSTLEETS